MTTNEKPLTYREIFLTAFAFFAIVLCIYFYFFPFGKNEIHHSWYVNEFNSLPEDGKRHFANLLKANGKVTKADVSEYETASFQSKKAEIIQKFGNEK